MHRHLLCAISGALVLLTAGAPAAENTSENVKLIPPPGIAISDTDRAELEKGVAELGKEFQSLRVELSGKPALLELLPDVQIYHKAVDWALRFNEFYHSNEVQTARQLLTEGMVRVKALGNGLAPWASKTGLVVRAYISKIDGSVQPYGLVVPPSYHPETSHRFRLDFWFHGRGEQLSELAFIGDREKNRGEFTPTDSIVLHLYGRYCNANRFAGETDLFEALESVRKRYPIDENRLVVRGFSMGGAACWQFATHYAGLWAAAAPGAGFSETAEFLQLNMAGADRPSVYEQKLWHLYDSIDYAANLFNCPLVAYSGEIDGQKQAADRMAIALAGEGMTMTHIIGPQTAHRYHPTAKEEINRRIDSIVGKGRDPMPHKVRFTTWTLRYNQMEWITVDGLEHHWDRARVEAELDTVAGAIRASTTNINALTFAMAPGFCPLDNTRHPQVILDGQKLEAPDVMSDRSWVAHFRKREGQWAAVSASSNDASLRKQHALQGPIDDAFMDAFIMVRPTGPPLNEKVGAWATAEMNHAMEHWRRQFRGEARVENDTEVSDAEIAANNLVLWGDPQSNQLIAKVVAQLPIRWDAQGVHTSQANYPADTHVPVLIYPNPLNPRHYIVINSGFTFREFDYLNNARQTPKLPDWAVLDLSVPVSTRKPGGIVEAGFFDEDWKLAVGH
ncbi:MAG TPA: prolyl oligopeptidase family serine peptidase [Verrucomicrobiae bacterium]|nr:prolyl oligopeptidase family serine peptidase [Verrucomicrobiae bacterium]